MLQQAVISDLQRNEIVNERIFFQKKWGSCEFKNKIQNVLSVHPYFGFKF